MSHVVITGVSSGLGYAAFKSCTQKNIHVFGTVRKQADADRLLYECGKERFTPILCDVTDPTAVKAAATMVRSQIGGRRLLGLVNNAGISTPCGFLELMSLEDFKKIFDVNLFGVHSMTQAFLPLLGLDPTLSGPPGRIVNVTSVAGVLAQPVIGAYCASKHALEGYSHALRRELLSAGIDVIILGPAEVESDIWGKCQVPSATQPGDSEPDPRLEPMLAAHRKWVEVESMQKAVKKEVLGDAVVHALTAPRPKTIYRFSVIKFPFNIGVWVGTIMSHRQLDWVMAGSTPIRIAPNLQGRFAFWRLFPVVSATVVACVASIAYVWLK